MKLLWAARLFWLDCWRAARPRRISMLGSNVVNLSHTRGQKRHSRNCQGYGSELKKDSSGVNIRRCAYSQDRCRGKGFHESNKSQSPFFHRAIGSNFLDVLFLESIQFLKSCRQHDGIVCGPGEEPFVFPILFIGRVRTGFILIPDYSSRKHKMSKRARHVESDQRVTGYPQKTAGTRPG